MHRPLLCVICAAPTEWQAGELLCSITGVRFHRGLTKLIRDVVAKAEPVEQLESRLNAPWFVCPNCSGDLEEYDEKLRSLRCIRCGLKLPATVHDEMWEIRELHRKETERQG